MSKPNATSRAGQPPKLRLRIEFAGRHTLGPGKIQLLEAVDEHGSISAAARSMQMSYRHAWEMLDDINQCFSEPAIVTETGGRSGGGAQVTDFGRDLVARFRVMQDKARAALEEDLGALARECAAADSPR
jgi:molybdate transport system regulatory protein